MRMVARLVLIGCAGASVAATPAKAQRWWDEGFAPRRSQEYRRAAPAPLPDRGFWDFGPGYNRYYSAPRAAPRALPNEVRDGGGRPEIVPVAPPVVPFPHDYAANTIVIDSEAKQLYYVLPGRQAYAYVISVGREGFDWFGTEAVSRKQEWPDWHPPAEMRERDPSLPAKMTSGLRNPLGAMALYLGNTLYRIHGTNDERSLGQAGSSGCFRMMNANVLHLAAMTEIGTKVHVVASLAPQRQVSDAGRTTRGPAAVQQQQRAPRGWQRAEPEWWERDRVYRSWRDERYERWR